MERQIEITLNIRRINNVDYPVRLLVDYKVARDDLLLRIRTERIYTGQVNDGAVLLPAYIADLLIDRYTGKIPDVLIGAGERVKKRGLTAILVADKRKYHSAPTSPSIFAASSTRSVNS